MSGELTELVHQTHAPFAERGPAGWAESWADDVTLDFRPAGVPGLGVYHGRDRCRRACEEWIATFEHFSIEIDEVEEISADTAIVHWIQHGTARGSEATGQLRYSQISVAHDGLWVRLVAYLDPDEARQAAESPAASDDG